MSRCEIKKDGNNFLISGSIDETFGQVAGVMPTFGKFDINLRGLKSINSTGIREWIKLMQKLKAVQISFYECPKVFIDQVNLTDRYRDSAGIGLRYNTPVGPINLEYARKLDKKSYESEGAFHLSVGVF